MNQSLVQVYSQLYPTQQDKMCILKNRNRCLYQLLFEYALDDENEEKAI